MQASQIGKSYEKTDRTQRRRAGLWTCLFLFTGQKSGEDVNVPLTKVEIVSTGEWDEDGNEVEDGKTRITVDDEEGDGVFTAHANHYDEEVSYGWVKLKYTWTNPWTNAEQTYGASSEEDSTLYIVSDIYSIELDYRNNSDMMLPNDAMTVDASLFHEFIGENGQDSEYMENFTLEINPDTIDETNNEYFSAELTDDKKGIRITTKGKENYDIRFQIIAKDGEENAETDEDGNEIWDELTARTYWIDSLDYDIEFEYSYGAEDNRVLFTDAPLTLTLESREDGNGWMKMEITRMSMWMQETGSWRQMKIILRQKCLTP